MSPKTSRMMAEEEDTRGSSGCFGWFFKLFKRKKRGCCHKYKDAETAVDSDPKIFENNDWGEEQEGQDAFDLQGSRLPHTVFVPCENSASPDNEATAAAATTTRMSACQRRKARRRALGAAMKASAASETAANLEESRASTENEEVATAESSDNVTEAHSGTSATKRRRARRKALAAKIKSEDRLARVRTEEPPAPNRTSVWLSPSVRVFGSDGRPFVTTWEKAAYGAFHAQRY